MSIKNGLIISCCVFIVSLCSASSGTPPAVHCDMRAIEKQQAAFHDKAAIILTNVETFWTTAFPSGQERAHDNRLQREEAWNPTLTQEQKEASRVNDGLGCVILLNPPGKPNLPQLCAPVDQQAKIIMEALREAWENTKVAPKNSLLETMRNGLPQTWAEEKTLYCVLQPESSYIDLNDSLRSCTPETK